jgi:hypothetical protein
MSDLAATFDAHVKAEFQDLDLEGTMTTMTGDPYVHHVPTITGGNGRDGVRDSTATTSSASGRTTPRHGRSRGRSARTRSSTSSS